MANITLTLAGLVFLLASVGARLHVLLDWPGLRGGIDTFFLLAAAWAAIVLLIRRPLWAITLGLTFGLLAANAFSSLYWPSLRPGIPIQDFLLADQVSANYSWDQVMVYLKTTSVMLTLGLAAGQCWGLASPVVRRSFGVMVAAALVSNLVVIGVQGAGDVSWLAAGSGSALDAQRASGLLEDSGASTVYTAAMLAGLLFIALCSSEGRTRRLGWAAAALLGAVAGIATGGRIFFVALAAATVIGVGIVVLRQLATKRQRVIAGVTAAVVAGAGLLATFGMRLLTSPTTAVSEVLVAFDPVRAVHWRVMARAFVEHPWRGTGLGAFYSNFWEHLQWALKTGGAIYADVPASMYLMLPSELGIAGVLIVLTACAWLGVRFWRLASGSASQADPWSCFACGVAASLAISCLVGIHVIFWSVPSLLILVGIGSAPGQDTRTRWFAPVWTMTLLLLVAGCVNLWATAPRAPEFRWEARGTPQVPVSLVVPIWPEQLEGIWAASGAEFLYDGKPVELHIERAREFYPMTLSIKVYDRVGQLLATSDQVFDAPTGADPGRLIQVPFGDDVNAACSMNITPDSYCTFRMTTTPEWTLDGQPVAALWVTRNLR